MDRTSKAILSISVVMALALLVPAGALAKGPPNRVETTNNLSFPAVAVDGYTIAPVAPAFVDIYDGTYPGLDAAQLALVQGKTMYAQKDPDGDGLINKWQADYLAQAAVDVDVIDWGDNIESVDAFVRRPFRLEVVLFDNTLADTMTGYNMALLEYPSSPDEVQGTDTTTYEGTSATVISSKPKLVIQPLGDTDPATLTWDVTTSRWVSGTSALPATPIGFAPELNVAGKYIYGASTGGWKPTVAGTYRVTFYIPTDSAVSLRLAQIAVPAEEEVTAEAEEGGGATPQIDPVNNLTYVDITVQPRNR
ncbi:MAG TPA: hypothetical protein VFY23_01080 [Candidatus Limnocylindrales bacterium]|nr:hypothetical protein [Candidatus Limnocylindrales bacterium]